jgi:hypothetical protein
MAKSKVQGENVSALAERFLTQLKHKGFTVNACEHVSGKQQAYVPVQDNALESYLAELTKGREAERAVVYEFEDEDVADLNDEAYAFEPVTMPVELAVIVHLGLGHEWLYGFGEGDVPVRCWSKKQAMRVPLSEIDQVIARLGKVDSILEWAA